MFTSRLVLLFSLTFFMVQPIYAGNHKQTRKNTFMKKLKDGLFMALIFSNSAHSYYENSTQGYSTEMSCADHLPPGNYTLRHVTESVFPRSPEDDRLIDWTTICILIVISKSKSSSEKTVLS